MKEQATIQNNSTVWLYLKEYKRDIFCSFQIQSMTATFNFKGLSQTSYQLTRRLCQILLGCLAQIDNFYDLG